MSRGPLDWPSFGVQKLDPAKFDRLTPEGFKNLERQLDAVMINLQREVSEVRYGSVRDDRHGGAE